MSNNIRQTRLMLIFKASILLLLSTSNSSIYLAQSFVMKLKPLNETAIHVNLLIHVEEDFKTLFKIKLKYQAQSSLVTPDRPQCAAHPQKYKPPYIEQVCNNTIKWFGHHDDPVGSNSSYLDQICTLKEVPLKLSENISYTITGLQPNVIYIIRSSVVLIINESNEADSQETCAITRPAAPQYPPQTDLSSFQIVHDATESYNINLFWRPVPGFLAGNTLTKYHLQCYNASNTSIINYIATNLDRLSGKASNVSLDLNYSYNCIIFAHNNHGQSKKSKIFIPKKSHIYDEHLEIEVSSPSSNRYMIQWVNLNDILSSKYPSINLQNGYYTLYWCQPPPDNNTCLKIEGMKKTRKNLEEITITSQDAGNKLFGVSYTLPDQNFSSGISWSNECLKGTLKSPFCDITSVRSDQTGTQLMLNWKEKCDPVKALMVGFEFEVCDTKLIHSECTDDEVSPNKYDLSKIHDPVCYSLYIMRNNSISEARFSSLTPAHLYTARMRVRFDDGTNSTFSRFIEKKLVSTTNPNCLYPGTIFPRLVSFTATAIAALCIVSWFYGQYTRYRKTTKSLTKVLDEKLDIQSSTDSFDFKYLINRSSSHAQTSLTSNPTSTVSIDSSGELSTAICVSEYTPVTYHTDTDYLTMKNVEKRLSSEADDCSDILQTILDNQHQCSSSFDISRSDSATDIWKDSLDSYCDDELSLDSHSSFLHQILLQPDPLHDSPPRKKSITYLLSDENQQELSTFII